MDPSPAPDEHVAAVAALDQPVRRDLYRLLRAADGWTTRDEAAAALDIPRSVAAFHLDKLAEAGVVEVRFERTSGRRGPGAGRPSKLYRPSSSEVAASIPTRHYDLAGSLLATAVAESTRTGKNVAECVRAAARTAGRECGEEVAESVRGTQRPAERRRAVLDALTRLGYEPTDAKRKEVALANCPFHRLAEEHRDLVCGMNLDFIEGLLDGIGPSDTVNARLDKQPGYCCVRIATR